MREVNVDKVTENIKEMCIEANHFLTDDMKRCLRMQLRQKNHH